MLQLLGASRIGHMGEVEPMQIPFPRPTPSVDLHDLNYYIERCCSKRTDPRGKARC